MASTQHEHHDLHDTHDVHYNLDERFEFSSKIKKDVFTILGIGIVLFVIGLILSMIGGGHHHASIENADNLVVSINGGHEVNPVQNEQGAGHGSHHGAIGWLQRLYANLWLNNVFFTGISLIGIFFFAIQYVASAGWSAGIIRVIISLSRFLPYMAVMMLGVFLLAHHDLFHWTHHYLYEKFLADGVTPNPEYDPIINGKKGFLNIPFFLFRMIVFFGIWLFFAYVFRSESAKEDLENGSTVRYRRLVRFSAFFIVFFAISSAISAWDWVMSIDTHWYSTMFGWYVFASWFVTGVALITMLIIHLKEWGYLQFVNEAHLHDLGKFVFGFSIFWTYIWFSQFLLIYYANIPEETVYFFERLSRDQYAPLFFLNIFLNFVFPFLGLMTRDSKRKMRILKIVCTIVIIGHWLDFYLMITPGTLKDAGNLGLLEIGLAMIYLGAFLYVVFQGLQKLPLIPKNHPMLEESLHHH
ncbi:MAG: quinol:cytochrome C oxidoreductase [Cytophagales bacterium]|nr:quinol:cytochrome C oxidoreductase [Cytophagales bacterium]MDW8384377.1 quinol:cytochrome C oxidoreductase [Flammeovirgaceae bacterium]